MQDQIVFNHYTPLRNHLRQVYLSESLYVLWAYNQLLQFNTPLPADIQILKELSSRDSLMYRYVTPWEIESLIKESILHAHEKIGNKTLKNWNYFAGAINKLKNLENYIAGKYIDQHNVLLELTRIAHRQFPWQSHFPQKEVLIRYYLLFSDPDLDKIIQKKIRLTIEKIYIIGMAFLGSFLKYPSHLYPITSSIPNLNTQDFEIFLNHFSTNLYTLKNILANEQEYNEKYAYSFTSLRAFPLIKMDYYSQSSIVCPSPTLLFWRYTSGLYYEICGEKGFENAFGRAFQKYVGKTLDKALKKYPFYPEHEYHIGNKRKDSIDWLIDSDALLFIECKTRRMAYSGKSEILNDEAIIKELEKMSNIIIQTYKTIEDFRKGYYPYSNIDLTKDVFPLIITLEDWYFFGDKLIKELNKLLEKEFKINNLPLEWLISMPYSICSIDEFEEMIQIIEQVGIKKFIGGKVMNKEKNSYAYQSYLHSEFPEEKVNIKSLFKNEWDEIFSSLKKTIKKE